MFSTQPLTHQPPPKAYKSHQKGTERECTNWHFFPKHYSPPTPPSPHCGFVVFLQNQKPTRPKKIKFIILLFAYLLMNVRGKQVVSLGSINKCVEIALSFLCVCFLRQTVSTPKNSRYSFFTKWTSAVLF